MAEFTRTPALRLVRHASRANRPGPLRPEPRSSPARTPPPVDALAETDDLRPILQQYPPAPPLSITHETVIRGRVADALWDAYVSNFEPLADLAILKHLDSRDEFLALLANPRIVKIVGWLGAQPAGLAMVTNSLEDVAEISPRFLRTTHPEHALRNAIYVGMLVMVSQPLRGRTLFGRLYTELWQIPALAGGVLIFDVCEFNRTMFDTDLLTAKIADSFPRSRVSVVDRQTWYAVELPEPIPGRHR